MKENKEWYETLLGLVFLSVSLNIVSNIIYETTRDRLIKEHKKFFKRK